MANPLHISISSFVLVISIMAFGAQIVLVLSISKCHKWTTNSGLQLITSLAMSDCIACVAIAAGAFQSLLANHSSSLGHVIALAIMWSWGCFCLHLLIMASERFAAIYFRLSFKQIFTPTTTRALIAGVWIVSTVLIIPPVISCCPIYYDFRFLTHTYNFSHNFVDYITWYGTTLGGLSTGVPGVLYILIAIKLVRLKQHRRSTVQSSLCWQFFIIMIVHTIGIVGFQLLPRIFEGQDPRYFYLITLLTPFDFAINPMVYFYYNRTIQNGFRKIINSQLSSANFPSNTQAESSRMKPSCSKLSTSFIEQKISNASLVYRLAGENSTSFIEQRNSNTLSSAVYRLARQRSLRSALHQKDSEMKELRGSLKRKPSVLEEVSKEETMSNQWLQTEHSC